MKTSVRFLATLALAGSLATAAAVITKHDPSSTTQPAATDPFAQMDRIFEMQMRQMRQMQQQMDAMFSNFEKNFQTPSLMQTPMLVHSSGVLSSGLQDRGDHYELKLKVNDLNNSKVKISSTNGMVTITTTLNKKEEQSKGKYGKIISYANSSSTQSFTLPPDADPDTIKAEQHDNTISLTIKKKKTPTPKTKIIPIQKKSGNKVK